ncbi:flagellar export chaperone FliS [Halothermothrix orenii]|uniref:Flagellar secretion chaperone FliS n=1 Tax=Halothermothrix orenii (strain H 168 / OCM 544 / DSM 9562) TaxID=373903 RepID=B8CYT3_HALOH|nr:flagellar export chaperone FliS [Halothermothrix orenii]ACL70452.1 flagellar protein FliS [Halothermothrix orenii H 168]
MPENPYQKYKKTRFETANREKLILMLYEGAIKSLNHAKKGMEEDNIELINESLKKSQDIINELMVSLNPEAGEIATNLYSLYDYMQRRLIEANLKKEIEPVKEVKKMVEELHETWKEAMLQVHKTKYAGQKKQGGFSLEG